VPGGRAVRGGGLKFIWVRYDLQRWQKKKKAHVTLFYNAKKSSSISMNGLHYTWQSKEERAERELACVFQRSASCSVSSEAALAEKVTLQVSAATEWRHFATPCVACLRNHKEETARKKRSTTALREGRWWFADRALPRRRPVWKRIHASLCSQPAATFLHGKVRSGDLQ
jgi:hypothetical protein